MSPANSIEIAIWVAVGGRGTLIGPIIGAFVVNLAKSWFTVSFPEYWLFFLGLLFIVNIFPIGYLSGEDFFKLFKSQFRNFILVVHNYCQCIFCN